MEAHCECAVAARQLAAELSKCSSTDARYAEVLKLYLAVVGTLCAVATKLRISVQSSRDSRITKLAPAHPYPWECDEPAVPNDGNGSERNFSDLLRERDRARGRAASLAARESPDGASFIGIRGTEGEPQ